MSLIDDALKRTQAMDRVAEDRPSAWTPTLLPDRRPSRYRALGIAAGLIGVAVIAFWTWKGSPKKETAVRKTADPAIAAAPRPQVADIPAAQTVEVAPPPRGISLPRNSAGVVPDRPLSDRQPAKAAPSAPAQAAEKALPPKPAEEARAAPAKREASAHTEEKLADGRNYTGEIVLGDDQKITLDGIVYSDENPVALINGMVITPGQAVDGMTVAKIEPDRVLLEGRGVTVFLLLK